MVALLPGESQAAEVVIEIDMLSFKRTLSNDSMHRIRKIRRRPRTSRWWCCRGAAHQRMRIGVGLINSRPRIRAGADIQLTISTVCVGREVSHAVRASRTRKVSSTRSGRARGWTTCQRAGSGSGCTRKAARLCRLIVVIVPIINAIVSQ